MSLRIMVLAVLATLAVVHTMPNPGTLDYRIPALYEEFLRQKSLQQQLSNSRTSSSTSSSSSTTLTNNMVTSKSDEYFRKYIEDPQFLAFFVNYMKQLEGRYEEHQQSRISQKTTQVQDQVALYKQFLANNKEFMTVLVDLFQQYLASEARFSSSSNQQVHNIQNQVAVKPTVVPISSAYHDTSKHVVVKPAVVPVTDYYYYATDGYNGRTSSSYNQQVHDTSKYVVVEPAVVPVTNANHYVLDGYNGHTSHSHNQQVHDTSKHVVVKPAVAPVTDYYYYPTKGYSGRTSNSYNQQVHDTTKNVVVEPAVVPVTNADHYVLDGYNQNQQNVHIHGGSTSNLHNHNIITNQAVNNQVTQVNTGYNNYVQHNEGQKAGYKFASVIDDNIRGNFVARNEAREGNTVSGSYSYDDGNVFRTVYYEADEKGFRVVKDDTKPSQKTGNLDGTARVEMMHNDNSVKYQINSNDIGTTSGTVTGTTTGTNVHGATSTTLGSSTNTIVDTASTTVVGTASV